MHGSAADSSLSPALDQFVSLTHWITCGVPLLLHLLLTEALCLSTTWGQKSAEEMKALFTDPDGVLSTAMVNKSWNRTDLAWDLHGMESKERRQLLLETILQVDIRLKSKSEIAQAQALAGLYTSVSADEAGVPCSGILCQGTHPFSILPGFTSRT